MRVEYLSDHGGQQLRISEQRLRTAESDLAAWHDKYRQVYGELQTTRRMKPLWRRVFFVSTPQEREATARVYETWRQINLADRGMRQIHHRVQQQAAGVRGEDELTEGLSELTDEWVMLRGYRNRRGETDHVLVGPLGLWAVEVKRRPIRLHTVGNQWWYEKLDSWENTVETGWAVDGGERSWARQVNDVARDLAAWLERNGHQVPVCTAVMLMHERARLGRREHQTVDLVGTRPLDLLKAIVNYSSPVSSDACGKIVKLIRRDHRFHNSRRR